MGKKGEAQQPQKFYVRFLGTRIQLENPERTRHVSMSANYPTSNVDALQHGEGAIGQVEAYYPQGAAKSLLMVMYPEESYLTDLIHNEAFVAVWNPMREKVYVYRCFMGMVDKSWTNHIPEYVLKITSFADRARVTNKSDFKQYTSDMVGDVSTSVYSQRSNESSSAYTDLADDRTSDTSNMKHRRGKRHKRHREARHYSSSDTEDSQAYWSPTSSSQPTKRYASTYTSRQDMPTTFDPRI